MGNKENILQWEIMNKKRLPSHCIQRAYMSIKHLPRDCVQRAFLRWFKENRTRFKIPLRLRKITATAIELDLINYPDCLSIWLSSHGLGAWVEWQDNEDGLICFDSYMHQVHGGYKCDFCVHSEGEAATLFPTLEALWQDHLFEKFLKWVNEKLLPARWLRVSRCGVGTWAELILDESKLSESDRTLLFMHQPKKIKGRRVYESGLGEDKNWLIQLRF